jgi:hemoglobin
MQRSRTTLVLLLAALALGGARTAGAQAPTLYKRLGGYDAIAAVTDDFIGRLATDSMLGRFFAGHSKDSQLHIRQLVVDQLCAATGGPCVYIGRSMKQAHAGLGITGAQWDRSVQLLIASLTRFSVPPQEQRELLAIATTLKPDIVDQP